MTPLKRLLVLATYPITGAATRYRTAGYFDAMRERGIEAELVSFYSLEEFERLYQSSVVENAASTLRGGLRLLQVAAAAARYDGVLVQREAAPLGAPWLERFLSGRRRIPLIFDFDDAVWLTQHDKSKHPILARLLRPEKALGLMRRARAVIAGSHALAARAREFNDAVSVLPTSVPAARWYPSRGAGVLRGAVPVVGWVGTHSTAPQLRIALDALAELAKEGLRFDIRVVGAGRGLPASELRVQSDPWQLETEVLDFQSIDVGLAPMFDDPWSAGKCGFKQIQYMATGVPMVTSPVGGAREFLRPEVDALFATGLEEWVAQLRRLLLGAELRARLATSSLEVFRSQLSLEAQSPRFVDVVERTLAA